jgi:hypothetical protein
MKFVAHVKLLFYKEDKKCELNEGAVRTINIYALRHTTSHYAAANRKYGAIIHKPANLKIFALVSQMFLKSEISSWLQQRSCFRKL